MGDGLGETLGVGDGKMLNPFTTASLNCVVPQNAARSMCPTYPSMEVFGHPPMFPLPNSKTHRGGIFVQVRRGSLSTNVPSRYNRCPLAPNEATRR